MALTPQTKAISSTNSSVMVTAVLLVTRAIRSLITPVIAWAITRAAKITCLMFLATGRTCHHSTKACMALSTIIQTTVHSLGQAITCRSNLSSQVATPTHSVQVQFHHTTGISSNSSSSTSLSSKTCTRTTSRMASSSIGRITWRSTRTSTTIATKLVNLIKFITTTTVEATTVRVEAITAHLRAMEASATTTTRIPVIVTSRSSSIR